MKKLLKIVAALVVLLVIGVVVLFIYIDRIAKAGIEEGATYALDVPTTLNKASVGVFSGTFAMAGLNVANPQGYTTSHFLNMGQADTAVSLGSLLNDKIEVQLIHLADIDVNLEKKDGKANYDKILDNLKRFESSEPSTTEKQGKKFVVHQIKIDNVVVHVDVLPIGGELTRVNVTVPQIMLKDIGSDTDQGVVIGDLTNIMVQAILRAVVEKGGDLLPKELLNDLGGALAQLKDLDKLGVTLTADTMKSVETVAEVGKQAIDTAAQGVGEATKKLGEATKDVPGVGKTLEGVGKGVEDVTKDAAKGVDDALKGVGDLLGGKKKDEKKDAPKK
jgi:uncharacterized protein involved in outer membrane biogenesis